MHMFPTLCRYSLEDHEKVAKYRGDSRLGYGNDEVRGSRVSKERGGENYM